MDGGQLGKPSQAAEIAEADAQAYSRQRAIQSGAFDLAGAAIVGPGAQTAREALKARGLIVNPRTQADFRFLLKSLIQKNGTPEQFKSLLLHAESWGHEVEKFRKLLGVYYPWT